MESHHRRKSSVKVVGAGAAGCGSSSLLSSSFEVSSSSASEPNHHHHHPSLRLSSSADPAVPLTGTVDDPPERYTSEAEIYHPPTTDNKDHPLPQGRCSYCHCPTKSTVMVSLRALCSIRVAVLLILCLQNSFFTVLRRYSQGILLEQYSKYECLLLGELLKIVFSAYMIRLQLLQNRTKGPGQSASSPSSPPPPPGSVDNNNTTDTDTTTTTLLLDETLKHRLLYLISTMHKMMALAVLYGAMNILSFVSLRNIGAGLFTIFAQAKIVTTAVCSALMLQRHYTSTQWRALLSLVLGVLLFSEPIWNNSTSITSNNPDAKPWLGTMAVLLEVTLSGFASIYFEKVIKLDPLPLTIWERNFQLALGSVPVYLCFIAGEGGGMAGFFGGWSFLALLVSLLGAAGGLLVALSIKYGDAILKTLATTGAIVLSSVLDHVLLHGPLTPIMMMAGVQVILAICNYTFDATPSAAAAPAVSQHAATTAGATTKEVKNRSGSSMHDDMEIDEEQIALLPVQSDASEGGGGGTGGSSSRKGE